MTTGRINQVTFQRLQVPPTVCPRERAGGGGHLANDKSQEGEEKRLTKEAPNFPFKN